MVKLHLLRKQAIIEYDGMVVKGHVVSCQAAKPGGELLEKKNSPNHVDAHGKGHATFSFGADFTGDVDFAFKGSASGEDAGTVTIP